MPAAMNAATAQSWSAERRRGESAKKSLICLYAFSRHIVQRGQPQGAQEKRLCVILVSIEAYILVFEAGQQSVQCGKSIFSFSRS